MIREVTHTGHSGYGQYCSSCGKWRGSDDIFVKIPDMPCRCGGKDIVIFSRYTTLCVEKTTVRRGNNGKSQ